MKSKESQGLERKQKVFMEPNDVFEWERTTDVECYCGHKRSSHLDGIEICLSGLRICEKFGVDKKEVVISPKAIARKNLPKISALNDESMTVHSNGKAYQ